MDDEALELTETFIVTLDRTPALDTRITLNPVDGDIDILDKTVVSMMILTSQIWSFPSGWYNSCTL